MHLWLKTKSSLGAPSLQEARPVPLSLAAGPGTASISTWVLAGWLVLVSLSSVLNSAWPISFGLCLFICFPFFILVELGPAGDWASSALSALSCQGRPNRGHSEPDAIANYHGLTTDSRREAPDSAAGPAHVAGCSDTRILFPRASWGGGPLPSSH